MEAYNVSDRVNKHYDGVGIIEPQDDLATLSE